MRVCVCVCVCVILNVSLYFSIIFAVPVSQMDGDHFVPISIVAAFNQVCVRSAIHTYMSLTHTYHVVHLLSFMSSIVDGCMLYVCVRLVLSVLVFIECSMWLICCPLSLSLYSLV